MNKTVKNLINKTIELEFYHMEDNLTGLRKFEHYEEVSNKYSNVERKVYETLPVEYHGLIDELIELSTLELALEKRYAFKEGVKKGLTDLDFLKEAGLIIQLI